MEQAWKTTTTWSSLLRNFFVVRALEGLEAAGEEQGILKDIQKGTWDGEKEEPVARAARELQGSSARSVKSAEWSLSDGLLYFWGKIYILDTSDLCRRIITLSHHSRLAGHSRRWKTLELVSRNYWWPQMSRVCWQARLHLWHVPSDQIILMSSDWRTPPSSHSICSVGYYQCGLHCRVTNQRQDDWVGLLPFVEFQYNNQVHSSTQHPPFLLDTGRVPQMGFEQDQPQSHMESINEFRDWLRDTLEEAKVALAKSKDDMTLYYNWKRTPAPEFKAGDMVFLDASDIQTTWPSRQLSHWRLGPFPIDSQVGNSAYWLHLPPLMGRLHPVFNVVKLSLAPPDPIPGRWTTPPPFPEIVDGKEEWVVEEILDSIW